LPKIKPESDQVSKLNCHFAGSQGTVRHAEWHYGNAVCQMWIKEKLDCVEQAIFFFNNNKTTTTKWQKRMGLTN
jgi:hypothetical protein